MPIPKNNSPILWVPRSLWCQVDMEDYPIMAPQVFFYISQPSTIGHKGGCEVPSWASKVKPNSQASIGCVALGLW